MKVLVTGANGFLARFLIKKCLKLGWEVTSVFHNGKKFIPKICKTVHINDLEKVKNFYDVIFLLSAFIPEGKNLFIPENKPETVPDRRLLDVNLEIPLRVVRKFRNSKIVFSSSASVYGIHNGVIFENSSFNNPGSYAQSKLSAEFVLNFCANYQIVRFSSIYGQGMTHKTFIPKLLEQAKKDKKMMLFGTGSRLQNYVYIEDAVGYLIAAASFKKSGIYLGVGAQSYSNTEVAKTIQSLVPGCKIKYCGEDNSPSFVYDNSVSQKALRFKPCFSLADGIGEMLNG